MSTTLATPIQFARAITGSNSSSMVDSNAIIFASDALVLIRKAFIKAGVDVGQTAEAYFTALTGVGQYNYPPGPTPPQLMLLKSVEVNFNDQSQQNYVAATKIDPSNPPQGYSMNYLRVNQSQNLPMYHDSGNFLEVLPTPLSSFANLVNAIRLIYFVQPTPFVATTDALVYPETQDTNILGYGIAATYLRSIFKFAEADKFEAKMYDRIAKAVAMMGTMGQGQTSPQGIGLTGYEF